MTNKTLAWLGAAALLMTATTASAHTGIGSMQGFSAGLLHPVQGVDHLLAMVAAGLWAASQGSAARWLLPVSFLVAMALGAGLGLLGLPTAAFEPGVAGSVLIFGLLLAFSARLPLLPGAAIVALFALLHGHAHGSELVAGVSVGSYVAGFLTTTTLLLAAGAVAGTLAVGDRLAATAGRLVAAAGALLLIAAV